jgi:hypothetical protein
MSAITAEASLPVLLRSFHLPAFVREYGAFSEMAAREGLSHEGYLLALSQLEASEWTERRVARLMSESRLPREKTLTSIGFAQHICFRVYGCVRSSIYK